MLLNRSPFPASSFYRLAETESTHWWFRARNRLLLWVLKSKVPAFQSFLEVGCGTGYVLAGVHKVYPTADLFGAEYFEEGLTFARERIPTASFRQLDATKMTESACYDVIGAFDVLEHIEQDELVLHNLACALKESGNLLITVPQHRWLWSKVDEHACHVRRYTRSELVEKIKNAGLTIEYATSFVSLLVPLMWLARRKAEKQAGDSLGELKISRWLNSAFEIVMNVELVFLKLGVRFPIGGSLLVVAKK
jgi:SAM-dependent methyltransferase